jgi:hypothetical protein
LNSQRYLVSSVKLAAQFLFFATAILPVTCCNAASNTVNEADFRTLRDQFLTAVRANDKNKLADLIAFPVWHARYYLASIDPRYGVDYIE